MPPNEDIEFPDDWAEWIHGIQDGGTIPYEGIQFIEDNYPEWVNVTEFLGLTPDVAALGIDQGFDEPTDISSITIHADGDNWWIELDGQEFDVDPANIGSVWGWYELGEYYDIDVEKDIDTGDKSE